MLILEFGPIFTAKWSGRCVNCDGLWYSGDSIGYVDSELNCWICYEQRRMGQEYEDYMEAE